MADPINGLPGIENGQRPHGYGADNVSLMRQVLDHEILFLVVRETSNAVQQAAWVVARNLFHQYIAHLAPNGGRVRSIQAAQQVPEIRNLFPDRVGFENATPKPVGAPRHPGPERGKGRLISPLDATVCIVFPRMQPLLMKLPQPVHMFRIGGHRQHRHRYRLRNPGLRPQQRFDRRSDIDRFPLGKRGEAFADQAESIVPVRTFDDCSKPLQKDGHGTFAKRRQQLGVDPNVSIE